MTAILKQYTVSDTLRSKNIKFFTARELSLIFDLSYHQTRGLIDREVGVGGIFLRLKNNLFTLKTNLPTGEEIANRLYQPSYVSLESALSRYGVIPEIVYTTTSVTTKPTREFIISNKTYSFTTIRKSAYTGYYLEKLEDSGILIAEPEKALADYLYLVILGDKTLNDRLYLKNINVTKLNDYVALYQRKSIANLVSKLFRP